MSIETIKVPDLGGAESVEVIEICVAVGDEINENDSLVVLESDKASMEVPSPKAGKVTAISISDGDTLSEGHAILELEVSGEVSVEDPVKEASVSAAPEPTPVAEVAEAVESEAEPVSLQKQSITVPDLGGPDEVEVIEVCVQPGDELAEGDGMVVLESDKASMEVPAPRSGKVVSISMSVGEKASTGDEILVLEMVSGTASTATKAPAKAAPAPNAAPAAPAATTSTDTATTAKTGSEIPQPKFAASREAQPSQVIDANKQRQFYAGPAVRMLARELGIDLALVSGTGPKGRITKDDLKAYIKVKLSEPAAVSGSGIPSVPEIDFSAFGEVDIQPLNKVQKTVAENMHRSWLNVPRVTQFDDADITELEDFRHSLKAEALSRDVKLTPLPFLLKACAAALKANPKFNASLSADGESIVYKHYVHIGVAVDTPVGLMVPVIRDVDKKSLWDLAAESAELAQKAKDRKLKPAEMQGGCFSISSLGNIGGQGFTPIINTPEVAILAVSKLTVKPVWDGSEFVPRKMLPLSLAYDHRAINGADAGRFFTFLNEMLGDIRRLLL